MRKEEQKRKKEYHAVRCGGTGRPSLMTYRRLCRAARRTQAELEEYCTAIEEFGLEQPGADAPEAAPIRCRAGLLAPCEVLCRAEKAACAAERLSEAARAARGEVMLRLLQRSRDTAEYRALFGLYIAPGDALWPEAGAGSTPAVFQ